MWNKVKSWFHEHSWRTDRREQVEGYGYVDRETCTTCGAKRTVF